ncbi:MAG: endopeptidase La [Christensenellales bacterium]|jgi:ATP-dependent Lon protease
MEDTKLNLILPLLPLRGLTVFPDMVLHFDVGRDKSVRSLEEAMAANQLILLVAQKDMQTQDPDVEDIHDVGTVGRIKQLLKLPGSNYRVLVEGLYRARIAEYIKKDPYFEVVLEKDVTVYENTPVLEAYMRAVTDAFSELVRIHGKISEKTIATITGVTDAGRFADLIASNVLSGQEDKQRILELFNPSDRLEALLSMIRREIEVSQLERQINQEVKQQIDKVQKEYYLNEQLKAIQKELGEKDIGAEADEYREKIENAGLSEEAYEKATKELERLRKMSPGSPETSVIRTYLDWIISLPWKVATEDNKDLDKAEAILEEDHFGLEKVKERVLEYLAVRQLTGSMKGPILCFVGPPGVGKTSIARSIARALGRKYVRMSLGGVRDEAEIRGHRRTYIGAIPGRIISSIKTAGSNNPLFLLDEIDKMSSDFRGDPASAMLEVLDPEQNYDFRDHYMEMAFDLSNVMFIATANMADTIPRPLLDRMEVIQIAGYTQDEKRSIARKYLLPKQLKEHGLKKSNLVVSDEMLDVIIENYTREAGVRALERQMANLCRKVARQIAGGRKKITLSARNMQSYLGIPRYRRTPPEIGGSPGIATGLAWTQLGGETLSIEVAILPGKGKLELTGQLGDVMKESAHAAMSLVRAHAAEWGIDEDFYRKHDIHVHIPEGAIPKDGPSAGITMATALVSALSGIPVRPDVAMTGEITLRGRVLPIGGVKEKSLAAFRAGVHTVIIPEENKRDLSEIPENLRSAIKFVPVSDFKSVLRHALTRMPQPKQPIAVLPEKKEA